MISKKEVEYIANLSRLGLTEKEIKKFQKELSVILDYIEKLKEANTKNIIPTSHPFLNENIFREDKVKRNASEKLLELAPEKKKRHIKVESIF
ncbi:MAG TPA: Asp-tRNA(Asn)/Glu-tRNA(Gln) amidotransferase subunit GatC [bacterium]|nr:Asp-tRNA(Asn)/Glu-tRNA(Gln) amidotransferase subunit GatC [bacterium]